MLSKFSNFPDELSENDESIEFELSRSDSTHTFFISHVSYALHVLLAPVHR